MGSKNFQIFEKWQLFLQCHIIIRCGVIIAWIPYFLTWLTVMLILEWILSCMRVFVVYILPLFGVTFLLEFLFFYIPFESFTDFFTDTISHPTMQYCVHLGSGIYGPLPILLRIFNILGLGIEFIIDIIILSYVFSTIYIWI